MMMNIRNDDCRRRLIFALDVGGSLQEAISLVRHLKDHVGMFKVGKEAFTLHGPALVEAIRQEGGEVFLDLKYHDIPNTVAKASEGAVRLGVAMFNVHASGGMKMMTETMAAVRRISGELNRPMPIVLAVTILTSLNDDDLKMLGFCHGTEEMVGRLAGLAAKAGVSGVVCSPQDIDAVRRECGKDFVIVTPGVRGAKPVSGDDQKRTLSPREAVARGADFLVVGRPIREASDPAAEADAIVAAIADGLASRS